MADNAAKEEIQNEKVGRKEPSLQAHGFRVTVNGFYGRRCKGA